MKKRNNILLNTTKQIQQRFSIRKLTIGAASVLIGATIFWGTTTTAHAADIDHDNSADIVISSTADNSAKSVAVNINSDPAESTQEQDAPKSNISSTKNDTANDSNEVKTSTLKLPNENSSRATKDLERSLTENKSTSNLDSSNSTKIKSTDQKADQVTITGPTKNEMMAGLNTNSAAVNFSNHQINQGDKVSVTITSDKANLITSSIVSDWSQFTDGSLASTNNGITYTYTYNGQTGILEGSSNVGFQANRDAVSETETADVTITVKQNDQELAQTTKTITILPYKNIISQDELVHAFEMGLKVPQAAAGDRNSYQETYFDGNQADGNVKGTTVTYTIDNNVSDDDPNLKDPNDPTQAYDPSERKDLRLVQYGVEWNFGKNTNLSDVVAKLKVSGYENILPSTIKVFRFTPELINEYLNNGNKRPDVTSYYSDLTKYEDGTFVNEDTNFEDYLKSLVSSPKSESISIDQRGQFKVNGQTQDAHGNDYDDGIYFIQFDTQFFPKQDYPEIIKGNGAGTMVGIYSSYIPPYNATTGAANVEDAMPISDFDSYSDFKVTSSESKTIKEKIIYIYANGPHAGEEIEVNNEPKTITFNRTIVKNGDVTQYSAWTTGSFDSYQLAQTLPGIDNGLANVYKIAGNGITSKVTTKDGSPYTEYNGPTVTFDSKMINSLSFNEQNLIDGLPDGTVFTVTVPYYLSENIAVHYIDEDNNNGTEINHDSNNKVDNNKLAVNYTGDPKSTATNNTQTTIAYLKDLGYVFDETATKGGPAHNPALTYNTASLNFKGDNQQNTYDSTNLTFDNDEYPNNQVYYVYLYHKTSQKQEAKTLAEIITYVDDSTGAKLTLPDNQNNPYTTTDNAVTFTRTITHDLVTGKTTTSNWTFAGSLKAISNPTVPGYIITLDSQNYSEKLNGQDSTLATTNANEVGSVSLNSLTQEQITNLKEKSTLAIVVPYKQIVSSNSTVPSTPNQNSTPSQPGSSTVPLQPTIPIQPSAPTIPSQPSHSSASVNHHHQGKLTKWNFNDSPKGQEYYGYRNSNSSSTLSSSNGLNKQKLSGNYTSGAGKFNSANDNYRTLPQTGTEKANYGLIGLAFIALAALLGIAPYRKHKN